MGEVMVNTLTFFRSKRKEQKVELSEFSNVISPIENSLSFPEIGDYDFWLIQDGAQREYYPDFGLENYKYLSSRGTCVNVTG